MKIGCQIGMWGFGRIEDALPVVAGLGCSGIEVFLEHLVPHYGSADKLKAKLQQAGLELPSVYFNSQDFIDPEKEGAVLSRAEAGLDFMTKVRSRFLVVNGGILKGYEGMTFSDDDFRQFAGVANQIGRMAQDRGLTAVLHPHWKCMVETPADVARLLAQGLDQKAIGLCVHAAHQLLAGADPYELYEKYADWVKYAHIGEHGAQGEPTRIGHGALDQKRLMKPLLEAGYDEWLIIEGSEPGISAEEYVRQGIEYLKSTWPEINWESKGVSVQWCSDVINWGSLVAGASGTSITGRGWSSCQDRQKSSAFTT